MSSGLVSLPVLPFCSFENEEKLWKISGRHCSIIDDVEGARDTESRCAFGSLSTPLQGDLRKL